MFQMIRHRMEEEHKIHDTPVTRSPNIRPDGTTAKVRVVVTDMKNWKIPRMRGTVWFSV